MTDAIITGLRALYQKGDVVEIRCWGKAPVPTTSDPKPKAPVYTGRYAYGRELVEILRMADEEEGLDCYYVLNPIQLNPGTLDFRILDRGGLSAWEKDVPLYRRFLLDFDPKRETKIATAAEHQVAVDCAKRAYDWLKQQGCTNIVAASSGNGVHLLPRIDLSNTPENKELLRKIQRSVAEQFSIPECECECFNDANRLTRAYGTTNKKGRATLAQPYNISGILDWSNDDNTT